VFAGDEIAESRCSYAQYSRFEEQERELIIEGWYVIKVIRELLDQDTDLFRLFIHKAIELAEPRGPEFMLTEKGRANL
jgi:hypothetical protein